MRTPRWYGAAATLCVAASALGQAWGAATEDFPRRPIRLIVVAPPGGPGDIAARIVSVRLAEALDRNVIVDNRPSVNGILGSELAAKAAPDGATLLAGNSGTHGANPVLYKKLPYDAIRDFAPITQTLFAGSVLTARPKIGPRSFAELLAATKKEPDKFNAGIPGATGQLTLSLLKLLTGIKLNEIPFKGSSPTELAVIAGEIDVAFVALPIAAVNIQAGRMKGFGTSTAKRSPLIPDVPTFDELGIYNFRVGLWNGLLAPAKTPDRIIRRLHAEIVRMFQNQDLRDFVSARGNEIIANTPEEFSAVIRSDIEKYRKVVAAAGIQLN
jgi:tripartite-type tricarboxylate transporter receptor subunit TctC